MRQWVSEHRRVRTGRRHRCLQGMCGRLRDDLRSKLCGDLRAATVANYELNDSFSHIQGGYIVGDVMDFHDTRSLHF